MRWWPRRRVYVDDLPETHDARFLAAFLLMLVGALGALYAVGYVVAGDKIPSATSVAGLKLGGLSRARAAGVLEEQLDPRLDQRLTVTVGGHQAKLTPREAGITLDVDATLDEAMDGSNWNPTHMLKVVEGGGRVDPVFDTDEKTLGTTLDALASKVESKPVSSTVTVGSGGVVIHPGRDGQQLDLDVARDRVVAAMLDDRRSVKIAPTRLRPAIDYATASAFADDTLRPAVSRPISITVAGKRLRLRPAQFGPALRATPTGRTLHLTVDADDLYGRTHDVLASATGRPVDARVVFHGGRPVVVPSHSGKVVDRADWAKAVLAAATTKGDRTAVADLTDANPTFTTSDAKALHITDRLSVATSTAEARLAGALRVAAGNLDATVVLPGQVFSYARAVGPVSRPTVTSPLGTATQQAASRAGLTVTQTPATSPVLDRDLQFRNGTARPVLVRAEVRVSGAGPVSAVVEIWGSHP